MACLATSKHSLSKGTNNNSHTKYKSPNPKKQKKQKKQPRTFVNDEQLPSPKLVLVVYDSKFSGNCAHACMANNIQLDIGNAVYLCVSDELPAASFENDFNSQITDLPEMDSMILDHTVTCCIAGE